MGKETFFSVLKNELKRIDDSATAKRHERVIEGFKDGRAVIDGKPYLIFNSNDYLGLRHNKAVRKAEEAASEKYGSGPGAVRFISGTLGVHKELEDALAKFHGREAGIVISSSFAANFGILHSLLKGQSKDSLVSAETLVVSDELNHRCIIDGIRVAGLPKENKAIFRHLDLADLDKVLEENKGKFKRVIVVTDGIFSMLGEFQDLGKMQEVCKKHDSDYEEGIITLVDDSHGVGAFGATGRGTEEHTNAKCDLMVGTLGKVFGTDGGYAVGDKVMIDYLRESVATYIYSNSISPGTAGAALASVNLIDSAEGTALLKKLNDNISYFKEKMKELGFKFAADSMHPIQPILIGDAEKCKKLTDALFEAGIVVTNINYPVVPRGADEIRAQLSAAHSKEDIDEVLEKFEAAGKELGLI